MVDIKLVHNYDNGIYRVIISATYFLHSICKVRDIIGTILSEIAFLLEIYLHDIRLFLSLPFLIHFLYEGYKNVMYKWIIGK